MRKPKLLFYTHGLVDGGGERLWASLSSEMKHRGHDVLFAQDFEATDNLGRLDPSIPVTTLGPNHVSSILNLARLLRRERPDVALAAIGGSNLKLVLARALARVPTRTVMSFHGAEEWRSGWLSWATYKLLPLWSRWASATLSVSHGLGRLLTEQWGALASRQRTILNPVFLPDGIEVPTAAELAARADVVLAVGRLVPEKDFATLIEAFARLDNPGARLVILGKGPQRAALEALIARLGLSDRVELAGYAAEPWSHYAAAKCVVVSSASEQFGNVVVEALAHGLPVVSTATTGPLEILEHGKHGRIVPIGDAPALAAAMAEALANPGEPAERTARAQAFSFAARVPEYEALVTELASGRPPARVYLDLTHLGRHVTGIERVSIEQFELQRFRGADVRPVRSRGIPAMILKQHLLLPLLALLHPRARFVFPGFPPSPLMVPARRRVVLYVHDLFLITRRADLSRKARLYMAPSFAIAIRSLKYFMTNSEKTRTELAAHTAPDAAITLYRPVVRNVFSLSSAGRADRTPVPAPLKLVMVGTVEPRKNYAGALAIRAALERAGFVGAELHVIGREGWGDVADQLKSQPGVTLHGYLSLAEARAVIEAADLYLCTSHDEGLGLPLVEAQFAGLPVAAPDSAVFREVLGGSGIYLDVADAEDAARRIAEHLSQPQWRQRLARAAEDNTQRWNRLADADAERARGLFERSLEETMTAAAARTARS